MRDLDKFAILGFHVLPRVADQMPQYQTRPAKQEDEPFLYACYKQTMREYVERAWGWNEEFQRASFVEHLPWQRFQIIAIGPIAVGGAVRDIAPGIRRRETSHEKAGFRALRYDRSQYP
jgi:hypothetical protein